MDALSLARAEAHSDAGQTVSREAAEILANIDAMELAIALATEAELITVEQLSEIHHALLERAANADRIAGFIRSVQNWIGGNDFNPCGANFVPPPADQVSPLLDDLVRFCNEETLPPLAQAALAHAQFETIHPFEDGNGRTGRALVQVLLRRRRLAPDYVPPISVVLAADKSSYIEGLVDFREGRENDWLKTFANAATRAAELAAGYLVEVQGLQDAWRDQLYEHGVRSDAVAWRIIDLLPAHPHVARLLLHPHDLAQVRVAPDLFEDLRLRERIQQLDAGDRDALVVLARRVALEVVEELAGAEHQPRDLVHVHPRLGQHGEEARVRTGARSATSPAAGAGATSGS